MDLLAGPKKNTFFQESRYIEIRYIETRQFHFTKFHSNTLGCYGLTYFVKKST